METADVIVIGGGISGLSCALKLLEENKSLRVKVLEASGRLGGRTQTIRTETGNYVDLGGQWLSPQHTRMIRLCERFGIQTHQQYYDEGQHVIASTGDGSRKTYKGEIPPHSILSLVELQFKALWQVNGLSRTLVSKYDKVKAGTATAAEEAEVARYDTTTVAAWAEKTMWTKAAKDTMNVAVLSIFGLEASQVSLLEYVWYTKQNGGVEHLIGTTGQAQDRSLVGGTAQVSDRLAGEFERLGGEVKREHQVTGLTAELNGGGSPQVTLIAECGRGDGKTGSAVEFKCRTVVVAVCPLVLIDMIQKGGAGVSPPLPHSLSVAAHRAFRGSYGKAFTQWSRPFWREKGFSGFGVDSRVSSEHLVGFFYDACHKQEGENGESREWYGLTGFLVGDVAVEATGLTLEERKRRVLNSVKYFFGETDAELLDYQEKIWSQDEFARGCPVSLAPPGCFTKFGVDRLFREPLKVGMKGKTLSFSDPGESSQRTGGVEGPEVLFWASTETADEWCGYMEGAVGAGERAAGQVLRVLGGGAA